MRWSIASLFLIGWLLTVGRFHGLPLEYTLLTALSLASCILLLLFLDGPLRPNLPIWIALLVFLFNYYLKFYVIVLLPGILETAGSTGSLGCTIPSTEDALFLTYGLTTCAFVAFCLVAVPFAVWGSKLKAALAGSAGGELATGEPRIGLAVAAAATLVVAKVIAYSAVNFSRGQDAILLTTLPAHTVAVVEGLIPATTIMLSLAIFDYGLTTRRRVLVIAALTLLFADAAADLLFVTGKAAFAYAALFLVSLWLVTGRRIRFGNLLFVGGCFLLTAMLYPFVIAIRSLRAAEVSMSMSAAVNLILSMGGGRNVLMQWGWQMTSLAEISRMIFMRLTGAEFTLALIDHGAVPMSWSVIDVWRSGHSIDQYAALEIFRMPLGAYHMPTINIMISLVGFFYMIGGIAVVAIGVPIFMGLGFACWRWLESHRFAGQSAFLAFFLIVFMRRVIEGDLDYQLSRAVPVYIMAAVVAECVLAGLLPMIAEVSSRPRRRREPFPQGETDFTPA